MDALDASQESLNYSKKKEIYQNYICGLLGPKKMEIDSGIQFIYLIISLFYLPPVSQLVNEIGPYPLS